MAYGIDGQSASQWAAQAAAEAAAKKAAEEAAKKAAEEAAKKAAEEAAKKQAEEAAQKQAAAQTDKSAVRGGTGDLSRAAQADHGDLPWAAEEASGQGGATQRADTAAPGAGATDRIDTAAAPPGDTAAAGAGHGVHAAGEAADAGGTVEATDSTKGRDSDAAHLDRLMANDGGQGDMLAIHQAQATNRAYQALPPEQQKQYDAVKDSASKSGVPDADTKLDEMLRTGQFDGDKGTKLLGNLNELATQQTDHHITDGHPNAQNQMVGEVIRQVANPEAIRQDPAFNTCGEASLERKFATEKPAEYVKLVADMASKDREAKLPDGTPVPLNSLQAGSSDNSDRSLTSTIFQQSMHADFRKGTAESALTKGEFDQAWQASFPESGSRAIAMFGPDQQAKAAAALKPGDVAIIDGDPDSSTKHAVSITDVSGGNVSFVDPNGMKVTVPIDAFQAHLRGATLPPEAGVQDTNSNWTIGGWGSTTTTSGSGSWYATGFH